MAAAPVTVVIPTHNHPTTLAFSLASVCAQTLADIDVVIIGDGVGDDTRDVVADLRRGDSRIRFVDRPKSGRTGEPTRHAVLAELDSPVIAYHGDDDLLFADHLETMVGLLDGNDFAHPLPLFVAADGSFNHGPFDASKSWWRQSIYPPVNRAAISLTGVVHTLESYRRLPYGWRATPPGIYTDQYMWQQYFALPGVRAVTGTRATTVKLGTHSRPNATAADRGDEIARWWALVSDPSFQPKWNARVAADLRRARVRRGLVTAVAWAARPAGPQWWVNANGKLAAKVFSR